MRTLKCAFAALLFAAACPVTTSAQASKVSRAAVRLAHRYLRTVDTIDALTCSIHEDALFIGVSRGDVGWRVLIISDAKEPKVVWDSLGLTSHDRYFELVGRPAIDYDSDGQQKYSVTVRGCMAHQCGDGRLGYAFYSSADRRVYVSHVTTMDDGSYAVDFLTKSDIPESDRRELVKMMCGDSGISRHSALPLDCSAR